MTEAVETAQEERQEAPKRRRGFSGCQVLGFVGVAMLVTALVTVWAVKTYVFPSQFRPVTLSAREDQILNAKLERLDVNRPRDRPARGGEDELEAGPYSEKDADREIGFTEKELNALIARNTDLAHRLSIDLSDNLASARLLIPLDDDFPIMGGKTIRVAAGLELTYTGDRPRAVLKGVSIMGVPLPNAWLGNMKNVDLVSQFGGRGGFWKTFSDGVEFIEIRNGELRLKLKE